MTDPTLSAIESWTGTRPLTCPWRAFSDPLVRRVLDARRHFEKGALALYEPDISNRLIQGIGLYDRIVDHVEAKRIRSEREQLEAERRAKEAARGR